MYGINLGLILVRGINKHSYQRREPLRPNTPRLNAFLLISSFICLFSPRIPVKINVINPISYPICHSK